MGRQFVFLHGGGQGGWVWDETITALQRQSGGAARCLALDGPGCGTKRGRDTSVLSFDAITRELVADVTAAGMAGAVLVGHSQAGVHMPAMIAAAPGLFSAAVFVSCVAPDPGLTVIEMTCERIHGGSHPFNDATLSVRDRYRAMFCNDMAPAQAEAFLDKLGEDQWPAACYAQRDWTYDHLSGLPVSYVLCLEDAILPLAWQERFAGRFHARTTPRLDAGHQVMNTRPEALAELLLLQPAAGGAA